MLQPKKAEPYVAERRLRQRSLSGHLPSQPSAGLPASRPSSEQPSPRQGSHPVISAATYASVLLLLLIAGFLLIRSFVAAHPAAANYTVCETTACKVYARMLSNTLNVTVGACDDFYKFVCSGWQKTHFLSVYRKHMLEFSKELEHSLRPKEQPGSQQSAADKASYLLQSCIKMRFNRDAELEDLKEVWRGCGIHWPTIVENADVLTSVVCLNKKMNVESIINIIPGRNKREHCLYIFTGSLVATIHRRRKEIESVGRYDDYYGMYGAMVAGASSADVLPFGDFLVIEDAVFSQLNRGGLFSSGIKVINLTKLAELTSEIPLERWAKLFATEFVLPNSCSIYIASRENILAFNQLLRTIGEKRLHYYVGWFNFQLIIPYLTSEIMVGRSAKAYGRRYNVLISCYAFTEAYMRLAMFSKYVQSEFTNSVIADVHSIIENIGATALGKVANRSRASGLSLTAESSVSDILHRLSHSYTLISSLDDVFANMSNMGDGFIRNWVHAAEWYWKVNRTRLFPIDVSYTLHLTESVFYTFFNTRTKAWTLPPYVTMLPLYESGISDVVKYAGLGSLLAIPAIYVLRREYPSLTVPVTRCFEDTLQNRRLARAILDFAQSSYIAWYAYKATLQPQSDVRLPFVSTYSHEQLFFIAFCYLTCGQLEGNVYSHLCNEPLRHNAHFAHAFSCPESSAMNHATECAFF